MGRELSAEVAARFGLKNGGVLIAGVRENSPAAKAGLKPDDAIVAVNGNPVRENRELLRAVGSLAIDQTVPISVVRGGRPVELSLKIEAQPEDYDTSRRIPRGRGGNQNVEVTNVPRAGLDLADLTE